MNNVVYGKTIEDVLKRQDIRFCTDRKKALNHMSKINFKRVTIFSKHLAAIHINKYNIKLTQSYYRIQVKYDNFVGQTYTVQQLCTGESVPKVELHLNRLVLKLQSYNGWERIV